MFVQKQLNSSPVFVWLSGRPWRFTWCTERQKERSASALKVVDRVRMNLEGRKALSTAAPRSDCALIAEGVWDRSWQREAFKPVTDWLTLLFTVLLSVQLQGVCCSRYKNWLVASTVLQESISLLFHQAQLVWRTPVLKCNKKQDVTYEVKSYFRASDTLQQHVWNWLKKLRMSLFYRLPVTSPWSRTPPTWPDLCWWSYHSGPICSGPSDELISLSWSSLFKHQVWAKRLMVFCTDLLWSFLLLLHKDDTACKMNHVAEGGGQGGCISVWPDSNHRGNPPRTNVSLIASSLSWRCERDRKLEHLQPEHIFQAKLWYFPQ